MEDERRPTSPHLPVPPAPPFWIGGSITLNQNWKFVRVTLDPLQKDPSKSCNEPTRYTDDATELCVTAEYYPHPV